MSPHRTVTRSWIKNKFGCGSHLEKLGCGFEKTFSSPTLFVQKDGFMDKEKFLLKRQLQHLKEIKGHGTEMISIYIPAEKAVADMSNKLRQELSQCVNIKSKQTQKAVESALTRLLHHLKTYGNATGKKGLALFCADDIYEVIPSEPIQVQMYKCGSSFELEPLERMLDVKKSYGLVLLDGRDASIARLRGTDLKVLDKLHSLAHSKHGHGGQSANRYARMREESIEVFYKRISESMDKQFLPDITEVIVGGPGPMKESFIKFKGYNYMFKILDCINTCLLYTSPSPRDS